MYVCVCVCVNICVLYIYYIYIHICAPAYVCVFAPMSANQHKSANLHVTMYACAKFYILIAFGKSLRNLGKIAKIFQDDVMWLCPPNEKRSEQSTQGSSTWAQNSCSKSAGCVSHCRWQSELNKLKTSITLLSSNVMVPFLRHPSFAVWLSVTAPALLARCSRTRKANNEATGWSCFGTASRLSKQKQKKHHTIYIIKHV